MFIRGGGGRGLFFPGGCGRIGGGVGGEGGGGGRGQGVRGGVHKRRIFPSISESSYPCELRF